MIDCILKCGGKIHQITELWSVYDNRLTRPVGICDRCGHVQISILPPKTEYKEINDRFFSYSYKVGSVETRRVTLKNKIQKTIRRLQGTLGAVSVNMLDIGAGEGWSSQVADYFNLKYHVVECEKGLAQRLMRQGAIVAASDINELLPRWRSAFDVVIFRHTLEHLLKPVDALSILSECLSRDGIIYLAVPNFSKAKPKDGFRTDYLRPIHISYFTPNKVELSLHKAGMRTTGAYDEEEIWAIASKGMSNFQLINEQDINRRRMMFLIRAFRIKDWHRMIKICIYKALYLRKPARNYAN